MLVKHHCRAHRYFMWRSIGAGLARFGPVLTSISLIRGWVANNTRLHSVYDLDLRIA